MWVSQISSSEYQLLLVLKEEEGFCLRLHSESDQSQFILTGSETQEIIVLFQQELRISFWRLVQGR